MNMLGNEIRDSAISIAKSYGHGEVEVRHVLFAIAKRFRNTLNISESFDRAKQALEPRGYSFGAPLLSGEAEQLLCSLRSQEDAIACVSAAFLEDDHGTGEHHHPGSHVQEHDRAAAEATSETASTQQPGEDVGGILAELDGLIGLDSVKGQVRNVIALVQANIQRAKAGLPTVNPSLHLVFTGPPGTGKTTVARLMARLYASTGALPGSKFTEASRADLVAGYVGQTAIKTKEIIARTRPGVLFIDEAYSLAPKVDADFGHEAIAVLVKAMEDHREDFAVVVAGYEDEMAGFIASNPGLRSRFKTYVSFPDYSGSELLQIFEAFALQSGIELATGVREQAIVVFDHASGISHFGNARFARSLFEQAYARMAARAAVDGTVTVEELMTIMPEDVALDPHKVNEQVRRIGFKPPRLA